MSPDGLFVQPGIVGPKAAADHLAGQAVLGQPRPAKFQET
jgi:hypothetical protein